MWPVEKLEELILDIPDFPKPGIVFKDITPLFESHEAFISLARHFARSISPNVKKIVAIESRGFILASAVAQHLNVGMVLVRKPGKLPRKTISHKYSLEYGEDTLEVHEDSLSPGDQVVIMDDILATGGTAAAAYELCQKLKVEVMGFEFLMEISALSGRDKLKAPINALITV